MSKIVLNKSNYFHNLNLISEKTGSKDKIAVVLKDNAYGHGLLEVATMANEFGIKKAVVRTLKEAEKIKNLFDEILILADVENSTYSHTFHMVVNSLEDIERLPENTSVHLKIDSGMHRNGITIKTLEEAILGISKKKMTLKGVMTHHKSADELSCEFFWQWSVFKQVKKQVCEICEKLFLPIPKFHSANSSALFRLNNFEEDFARVGIAQYGYLETNSIFNNPNLKPVMSLWTKKISSRIIEKNEKVGYGGVFISDEKMEISTYDIGYGDGFLRLNGKQKYLTPKGYEILGRVSMDNISINSTDNEVCIFDDVKELAKIHNTISYEIVTTLMPHIKREIKE